MNTDFIYSLKDIQIEIVDNGIDDIYMAISEGGSFDPYELEDDDLPGGGVVYSAPAETIVVGACSDWKDFTATSEYTVEHSCGRKYVNVVVVDGNDEIVDCGVKYLTDSTFKIYFSGTQSGRVIWN